MLLREAARACQSAKPSATRRFALLCSFEPLHLKTYLQAFCALRFPGDAPVVETFGFDQLRSGLERTGAELKNSPAALVLSWEDLHPSLSWRARGGLAAASPAEIAVHARDLRETIDAWVRARPGISLVALPPRDWLPLLDPCPSPGIGAATAAAVAALWDLAGALTAAGARVLDLPSGDLNYRDLLQAGHPLTLDRCENLARSLTEAAFPAAARKKALVVDLDGTLWNGVIGEDGPQAVGASDHGPGHPHHVFQKFLLKLKSEGVLLALCSKNNPADVLPFFDSLDMPMKLSDFSAARVGWEPKPASLREIASELNVGADSLVFVDDNEAELAEMRRDVPEAETIAAPRDSRDWPKVFARLQDLFGAWRVGEEDRLRTGSAGRTPAAAEAGAARGAGHLRDLQLRIAFNHAAFSDPRSLELINKTNQFNLTGERIAHDEWLAWAAAPGAFCVSAKLSDRHGDFGTVCVATGRADEQGVELRQLVLSCRAFGRCVETLVLDEIAGRLPGPWIRGPFKSTGKNEPARRFLASLGVEPADSAAWRISRETLSAAAAAALAQSGAVMAATGGRTTNVR